MSRYVFKLSKISLIIPIIGLIAIVLGSCQASPNRRLAHVERIGSLSHSLVVSYISRDHIEATQIQRHFDETFAAEYPFRFHSLLFSTSYEADHHEHLIEVRLQSDSTELVTLKQNLDADPRIAFASEVYQYQGQGLESIESFDELAPANKRQHLETIGAAEAWQVSRGDESIIIAVTDDGFDFTHKDLQHGFWQNDGEIGNDANGLDKKKNGLDDDQNGYIDDYRGWDFTKAGDNDPSPETGLFLSLDSHGTHIAGIINAAHDTPDDDGSLGIAPHTRVMALRFSGSGTWTSINIARSYAYAVANGARIINTSYAIDQYIDDPVYLAAIRHAYQNDVIIFNSAGNSGQANPDRQFFEEILLVANTYAGPDSRDRLNPNSNYGSGIDFTAPGDVYSTVPGDRYQYKVGTSMSTPVVAAVAALIWSARPDWTRDQVVAHLAGTAESIDKLNPGYERMLGFGRVHAGAALTRERIDPPRLEVLKRQVAIDEGKIRLRCLSVLDAASLQAAKFLLRDHLHREFPLDLLSNYRIGSNEIELGFPPGLQPGSYELYISPDILDPFGQPLDGNHDGIAGDPLRAELEITRSHQNSPYIESIQLSQQVLQAGQTLEIHLYMHDEQKHINQAQLVFTKFDGSVNLTVTDASPQPKEVFQFQLEIPLAQDNGVYHLSQIELTNLDGSKSSFLLPPPSEDQDNRPDFGTTSFEVTGGKDRDRVGPQLVAMQLPELGGMGSKVPVTVSARDELSGVAKIEILLRSLETFQTLRAEKQFPNSSKTQDSFELELSLPRLDRRQEFFVAAVVLTDRSGNVSRFQASDRSENLTGTKIPVPRIYLVEDINSDITPPRLLDIQLLTPAAYRGEEARVLIHATDDESQLEEIRVFFRKDLVVMTSIADFEPLGEDLYEIIVPITKDDDTGSYRLYKIELADAMGNKVAYQSLNRLEETYPGTEIPVLYLDVQARTPIDGDGPQIRNITIQHDPTQKALLIELHADDQSGIEYIDLSMVGTDDSSLALWSEPGFKSLGNKRYQVKIRLDRATKAGTYYINYLLAADSLGNMTSLQAEAQQQYFPETQLRVPRFHLHESMLP